MRIDFSRIICTALLSLGVTASASADRLSDMISPGFHPVTFEDPRSISEARLLYAHHQIDDDFVTGGGDVNVYALQLRYAVNDRLALIATKDGFVDFNPNTTLSNNTGWADIEVGAKYALYQDSEAGQILTAVMRYTIPTGNQDVLQGKGSGEIHPTISGAIALSERLTLTADTGFRIATDSSYSSFWDSDLQLDYRVNTSYGDWYPLVGASLIHVLDAGNQLPIADEGQDFFNLGAAGSGGENMAIGAAGLRFRPVSYLDLGATFQFPLDGGSGTRILDNRWTFDAIFRF